MKKIIFTAFICMAPIFANATDMCARDNVMVLAFDPQVGCVSKGENATEWSWWVQIPYGRIVGEATCLSAAEGLGQTSVGAYYGKGEYSSTFITADSGLSGVDANGAERIHCWCKMMHPAVSRWVYVISRSTVSECKNTCPLACTELIRVYPSVRAAFFKSIGL